MSDNKFRGVSAHKEGGYVANIGHKGGHVYLGYYRSFEDAVTARIKAEVKLFGAVFDRRETHQSDSCWHIPLHGHRGAFHGWALVDVEDFDRVRHVSWTVDPRGYVIGRPPNSRTTVSLHSMLLTIPVGMVADHINGNKRDNRRQNLRACSQKENSRNTAPKKARSGVKGVSSTPHGKWRARIMVDRREINLGRFVTIDEAKAAYDKAAIKHFGEFARLNDPESVPMTTVKVGPVMLELPVRGEVS